MLWILKNLFLSCGDMYTVQVKHQHLFEVFNEDILFYGSVLIKNDVRISKRIQKNTSKSKHVFSYACDVKVLFSEGGTGTSNSIVFKSKKLPITSLKCPV